MNYLNNNDAHIQILIIEYIFLKLCLKHISINVIIIFIIHVKVSIVILLNLSNYCADLFY